MSAFPFKPDLKLTDVLKKHGFTYSAEIIPPRNGTEQAKVLSQIERLIEAGAQFLAVTKGAGGSLRGGSLPIAQAVKENFQKPCIAHFTCRDLTPQEVENQLIDHHYFGIRNILALRGDPPQGQPEWKPREGGYLYAYQLIDQITKLNRGEYLKRQDGPQAEDQTVTDFCIGAAVYPEHPDFEQGLDFFELKVKAGAHFGITDMVFDPEKYARFRDACVKRGLVIPILPGTRLLKTQDQAQRMSERFKASIPASLMNALPKEDAATKGAANPEAVNLFIKTVERFKALGAPGVHLFVISDTAGAVSALQKLTH